MRATAESRNEDADHITSHYQGGYIYCERSISNHPKLPGGCTSFWGVTKKNDEMDRDSFMYAHMYGFHNTRQ